MAYLKTTKINKKEAQKEIRKLTAVALSLLLGMTALTQWMNFGVSASNGTGLSAIYFEEKNLTEPKVTRLDDSVDFDWDFNSPDPSMGNESYSARWTGSVEPRYSDTYNFYTFSDDGVRLWVDGKLIIDNWTDHPRTENIGYIKLDAGKKYAIKLEYYENTGRAILQLSWSSRKQDKEIIPKSQLYPTEPEGATFTTLSTEISRVLSASTDAGLKGEYFDRIDLTGFKFTRTDSQVNFDWNYRSPDSKLLSDTYSIRWTGQINPPSSGTYNFYTHSDDGVRLWVNNQLVIDNWTDHPVTENSGKVSLEGGISYPLKLEYYERYGQSSISLSWSGPGLIKQVVSSKYFGGSSDTVSTTPVPAEPLVSEPTTTPTPTTAPISTATTSLGSTEFFVNPYSQAMNWVNNNRTSRPYESSQIEKIAQQPTAQWLGGWNWNIADDIKKTVTAAASQGKTAVFVAYNIPQRDCGSYSAGGVGSYEAYRDWIGTIASSIGGNKALVILEPDALALMECLSAQDKENRMAALKNAVGALKKNGNTAVYLDAGHSGWVSVDEISARLNKAGISQANGFALNTSNFVTTADNTNYGTQISGKVGGKKFVIDTSRNGSGPTPDYQWCNPSGRTLGHKPTTNTENGLVDAYLWIKAPGESDGNCNGGPSAGTFWAEYAIDLVKKSGW